MHYTILDCYTDEASGLGVPPYLGVYPRYIYGKLRKEGHRVSYLTIDDVRLWKRYHNKKKETKENEKTNIIVYNTTKNNAQEVLSHTNVLIVVLGIHVPGKYLTAVPATLREVISLIKDVKCKKILTGPAVRGTQLEGGKWAEEITTDLFDDIIDDELSFDEVKKFQQSV
jgi:radical SAM superfamily enzyme with C-terminal helix-hairpin-helix motif